MRLVLLKGLGAQYLEHCRPARFAQPLVVSVPGTKATPRNWMPRPLPTVRSSCVKVTHELSVVLKVMTCVPLTP